MATATLPAAKTTMPARFDAACPRCKQTIRKGTTIEKVAGLGWCHEGCEAVGGMQATSVAFKTSRRDHVCHRCGKTVAKGQTVVRWVDGPQCGASKTGEPLYYWVHQDCGTVAAAPEVASNTATEEFIRKLIAEALAKLDTGAVDAEVGKLVDGKVADFAVKMAAGVADACKKTADYCEELVNKARQVVLQVQVNDKPPVEMKGIVHPAFERVLKLAAARKSIFLPGPAGCGKSHMAQQVAEALGLSFGFISCSAGMSEGQLLGRLIPTGEAGKFEYSRSEFVRCYEEGGVFLIDEIDAADSNVLLVINAALANGHMALPNRPEKPVAVRHKDFVCVAAANTFGTGANRQYVGRNQLDEATLDRFRIGVCPMDYDPKLEKVLCPFPQLRAELQKYRRKAGEARLNRIVSTRFMRDAADMMQAGWGMAEIEESLFSGWSSDEIRKVKG